jgi:HEAT repeat protein
VSARKPRTTAIDRELAALEVEGDAEKRAAVRVGLQSAHARVLLRAAHIARAASIEGIAPDLALAFTRLLPLGAAVDPGCHAKIAVLDALDASAWPGEEPFITAVRVVQREKAFGPPYHVDTAAGVRARGVLALMRQGYRDLPLIAAELLADPEAAARGAAADALGAHGLRDAAGPLISRIAHGDEDPTVTVSCFTALLALAPDWTMAMLRRGHCGAREIDRELASVALGTSRREDALDLLIDWLSTSVAASVRETMLVAIGLHRTERALAVLLERLADGPELDAIAAARGLRARRFDAGVVARATEAASARSDRVKRAIAEELDVSGS